MTTQRRPLRGILIAATVLALAPLAPAGWAQGELPFGEANLFFELNDTDGDLGIHALIDGEPWRRLEIEDPFDLTGIYEGIPLTERSVEHFGTLPDRIRLFRRPILDEWASGDDTLEHLVAHVLIHEAGHHFGLSDEDMHALEEAVG